MRRAPKLGQKLQRLQLSATRLWCRQVSHLRRRTVLEAPAFQVCHGDALAGTAINEQCPGMGRFRNETRLVAVEAGIVP